MKLITRAHYGKPRDRLVVLAQHMAGALDIVVFLLTLSVCTSNFRAMVLFSDWAD